MRQVGYLQGSYQDARSTKLKTFILYQVRQNVKTETRMKFRACNTTRVSLRTYIRANTNRPLSDKFMYTFFSPPSKAVYCFPSFSRPPTSFLLRHKHVRSEVQKFPAPWPPGRLNFVP